MRPIDIAPADLETIRCILREYAPGLEVRAFGSRVSWTARETSDLDVALLTEEPLSIARMTNLKAAFTKSYLPFRVDIVDWASTSENFRKVIEREHVVLVDRHRTTKLHGWRKLQFGDAFQVNPKIHLKRGNVYPFVSMAVVDTNSRDTYAVERRKFSSGGSRFANGDTLMARITPCLENGKITRFCSSDLSNFGHGSTEFIVIRGTPNLTDNEFAYYLTRSEQVRSYAIKQMTGTSGRQRVPTDSLIRLIVSIPPLSEQHSIARILGALDDKIELNRRMNKTLEEMAETLFKSWFVDFDPVKAKLAVLENGGTTDEAEQAAMCTISGNDEITLAKLKIEQPDAYASIAQIASQFPSAMQKSELGGIPKGWKVKVLSCFGDIVTGKTPSTKELKHFGDDVPFLRIPDMHGKIYVLQTKMMLSNDGASSQPKKTLPPGSTSVSCIATPGLVVLNHRAVQTNQQINSIVPKDRSLSRYIFWSCRHLSAEIKIGGIGGSVYSNMKKSAFSSLPVLDVGLEIVRVFDQLISPLHDTILSNEKQSHVLAHLRDTLLPKLVSGKLQVGNAKR